MRLIAPLLLCMIGAIGGAAAARMFGRRGTGVGRGALIGLLGGFAGLWLRDAFDLELGGATLGALVAVTGGGFLAALLANLLVGAARR